MNNGNHSKQDNGRASMNGATPLYARIGSLTKTEQLVLRWVEKGKRNKDIAEILGCSKRTIDCHVSAILGKLQTTTRGEAASLLREAQAHGWVARDTLPNRPPGAKPGRSSL